MRRTLVATAVLAFAVTGGVLAGPASAAPNTDASARHAYCGRPAPTVREGWIDYDAPSGGAVNQRNGTAAISSSNCTIVGVLQPTDDAEYFCWTEGNDGYSWTYLRNLRTNVRGWARDNLLDDNGSVFGCGF